MANPFVWDAVPVRGAAYDGTYRIPMVMGEDAWGRVPATVFKMTDEAKARARIPKSLYQRQPNWEGLPHGAAELLEGRSIIHMFETGNLSTWIHELGDYDDDDPETRFEWCRIKVDDDPDVSWCRKVDHDDPDAGPGVFLTVGSRDGDTQLSLFFKMEQAAALLECPPAMTVGKQTIVADALET